MLVTGTQLWAHMLGDYVFQNHWMANKKTTMWSAAWLHAIIYTTVFWLVFGMSWALVPICLTHLVIDKYRLASKWVDWWGIGKAGSLLTGIQTWMIRVLEENERFKEAEEVRSNSTILGMQDAPPWLSFWLLIIVDNVAHCSINALSLMYLG